MKKILNIIIISILLISSSITLKSQNNLDKTDDLGRISLMPVVPTQAEGLSASTNNLLQNKLGQIATKNGLGGGYNNRFVITANVSVLSKDITSTAPSMHVLNLEITLYIADYVDKTIFSNISKSLKGVGTNETKAYIQAIKNINPSDPVIRKFVETGKEKIIELYNSRCDFFLEKADALAKQKKYEEAIYHLTSIPEVCKECYAKASDKVKPLYAEFANTNCEQLLIKAKAEWAGEQNSIGASKVADLLSKIDPDANCISDAEELITQIKSKVKTDEDKEWDFQLQQWDDEVDIEEQRIAAQKEVGIAYANKISVAYAESGTEFIDWIFSE